MANDSPSSVSLVISVNFSVELNETAFFCNRFYKLVIRTFKLYSAMLETKISDVSALRSVLSVIEPLLINFITWTSLHCFANLIKYLPEHQSVVG